MQVISRNEFSTHQQKYFDLARHQEVLIQDGDFTITMNASPTVELQTILEPDEDFFRAISMEELLEGIYLDIHKKFANRK